MRLLNTSTLSFEEFVGERPRYAAISHRWSDEEPTHQDFLNGAPRTGYGWDKIYRGCQIARERGIPYLWIDTIWHESSYIDKKSSAELSEAINSMFRWYADSSDCYAFLSDVPPVDHGNQTNAGKTIKSPRSGYSISFYREDFSNSVWFTRGCNPRFVDFYNSEFDLLGRKSDMESAIAKATGIQKRFILRQDDHTQASIAERMKWAARRKTARPEDLAYCLLGLFEVNMPLLYGEGTRAFMRLQLELIRKSDDESIFTWFSSDTPSWQGLLASSPRAFAFDDIDRVVVAELWPRQPFAMTNKGLQLTLQVPDSTRLPDYWQKSITILLPLNCEAFLSLLERKPNEERPRKVAIRVTVKMRGQSDAPIFEGQAFRERTLDKQLILAHHAMFEKASDYGCSCINGVPDGNNQMKTWIVYFKQDGI